MTVVLFNSEAVLPVMIRHNNHPLVVRLIGCRGSSDRTDSSFDATRSRRVGFAVVIEC